MVTKNILPGALFLFKKPTKALITKHNLEVETLAVDNYGYGRRRPDTTLINGKRYSNEYFGSTVIYSGPAKDFELPTGLEGGTFFILDKARVQRKETIARLIGNVVRIPFILLTSKGMIIDMAKLPPTVQAAMIRNMSSEETLLTHKYKGSFDNPITALQFLRRNAVSIPNPHTEKQKAELAIRRICRPGLKGSSHALSGFSGYLICGECRYNLGAEDIIKLLEDHTKKKRYVNAFTLKCPSCNHKYKLVINEEGTGEFVTVKRDGDIKLFHEDDVRNRDIEGTRLLRQLLQERGVGRVRADRENW